MLPYSGLTQARRIPGRVLKRYTSFAPLSRGVRAAEPTGHVSGRSATALSLMSAPAFGGSGGSLGEHHGRLHRPLAGRPRSQAALPSSATPSPRSGPPTCANRCPHADRLPARAHNEKQVASAFDEAVIRTRITLDWRHFLCVLLGLLPRWWTKLTRRARLRRQHDAAAHRRHVMCQEQGGKRWRKLTPDSSRQLCQRHLERAGADALDPALLRLGGARRRPGAGQRGRVQRRRLRDQQDRDLRAHHRHLDRAHPPAGWPEIGDAPARCCPTEGCWSATCATPRTAIFDPATDTFSAGPAKPASSAEESWVLLPDETVITVRCDSSRRVDKYVAAATPGSTAAPCRRASSRSPPARSRPGCCSTTAGRSSPVPTGTTRCTPRGAGQRPGHLDDGPRLPGRRERPDGGLQGHPGLPADQRQGADRRRASPTACATISCRLPTSSSSTGPRCAG